MLKTINKIQNWKHQKPFPGASILITSLVFIIITAQAFSQSAFIRVNQVGFLPGDLKTAALMSTGKMDGKPFYVVDLASGKNIFSGKITSSVPGTGSFRYLYYIDFSTLKNPGAYKITLDQTVSDQFLISPSVYNRVVDSLMVFFKIQRCGYTSPLYHYACHPDDASRVIYNNKTEMGKVDVTGGWHDAGDYVKFLNTAAYTTYTLLFAYDFDPVRFGFDNNKNGVPDILEEAKIGLDWLLRLNYTKNKLITQVQDLRDHDQGWRRPEADLLMNDRPAFSGMGKNIIGIYSATLSLASRIWREKLKYNEFADKCLNTAARIFAERNAAPDLDKSPSGVYQDTKYEGKLALGAVEMYLSTGRHDYLQLAVELADRAKADFWWSFGDINAFAHYRLAFFEPRFKDYILENIKVFNSNKNNNPFGPSASDNWGSNNAVLGAALQSILWKRLTNDNSFDSLAVFQRDFILGRNQWGISFIQGTGTRSPKAFHSQLAYFNKGRLTGAVAAGPVSRKRLDGYKIKLSGKDELFRYQSNEAVYQDDRNDWITNEPTISCNATALFVMGCYSHR